MMSPYDTARQRSMLVDEVESLRAEQCWLAAETERIETWLRANPHDLNANRYRNAIDTYNGAHDRLSDEIGKLHHRMDDIDAGFV